MSVLDMNYFQKIDELLKKQSLFVSVTVVEMKGSYPQTLGAKMIVMEGEELAPVVGTIGGGNVEAQAIRESRKMLLDSSSPMKQLVTWNLNRDLGMSCGGEVKLLLEVYGRSSWKVALFGAGHVAQALSRLLLTLDCQVICFDDRDEWLAQLPHSPMLIKRNVSPLSEGAKELSPGTFVLSMTPGHRFDLDVLKATYEAGEFPYVGAIGSRSKAGEIKKALLESGVSQANVDALFCPIGFPIGNNTPGEVTISIASQLLQERDRVFGTTKKFQST